MQKEFIPYEQALVLKELGFDEPCLGYYKKESHTKVDLYLTEPHSEHYNSANVPFTLCSAPLYQQAFRWFREKHGLACWISPSPQIGETIKWCYDTTDFKKISFTPPIFDTYEDAQLACFKKLIEIVKEKNGNGL